MFSLYLFNQPLARTSKKKKKKRNCNTTCCHGNKNTKLTGRENPWKNQRLNVILGVYVCVCVHTYIRPFLKNGGLKLIENELCMFN